MIRSFSKNWILGTVGSVLLLGLAGCKEEIPETQLEAESKLRPLTQLYFEFRQRNRGRPPKDEAQFKEFIGSFGQRHLQGRTVDEMLVSSRDNQKFVFAYGRPIVSPQGFGIVAYEQEGVDGKRYVADDLGVVSELNAEAFQRTVPTQKPD